MESNNNQGEGNGHEQPPGLPPHVFQLFEDGQRVPQHQQDQDQDQDQAAMNTTFAVNPVNQDFGNLVRASELYFIKASASTFSGLLLHGWMSVVAACSASIQTRHYSNHDTSCYTFSN